VQQAVRFKLFVGDAIRTPGITTYAGRGPLGAWVSMVAQRVGLSLINEHRSRAHPLPQDDAAIDAVNSGVDCERSHLRKYYKPQLEAAILEALQELSDRACALIYLHFGRGVTLQRIGAMYGVNQSTASRWLAGSITLLRRQIWRALTRLYPLRREEFSRVNLMLLDDLELDVLTLLGERLLSEACWVNLPTAPINIQTSGVAARQFKPATHQSIGHQVILEVLRRTRNESMADLTTMDRTEVVRKHLEAAGGDQLWDMGT
jgi:RNA polymerase sigma-70 factor (ECF subfamily)